MYKEVLASEEANEAMRRRIEMKTAEVAEAVVGAETDEEFFSALHDLCVLNRMADSHEK